MAGVFPSEPGFVSVATRVRHFNLRSESINGKIQVRKLGSSRREFTLQFPPMTKAEFEPIYDFVLDQEGDFGTFSITLPSPTDPTNEETVTCRLMSDIQEFAIGRDSLYEFEVDIVEVI